MSAQVRPTSVAAEGRSTQERHLPTPSAGRTGTAVRLLFGVVWALNAFLKWQPGYRHQFISMLKSTAQGQPSWLHWWFHFWISFQSGAPTLFATLTGLMETSLALVLILGVGRRAGYAAGAVYALLVWAVGDGFGGPYMSGATDIGTGIVYTMMFITLLALAPPARRERLSLDRLLVGRYGWWRWVAEPHAVDRVHGVSRSANDIWAVGGTSLATGNEQTFAEHFNGSSWSVVPTPSPRPAPSSNGSTAIFDTLNAVSITADGHVYAVGDVADNFTDKTLILENDLG